VPLTIEIPNEFYKSSTYGAASSDPRKLSIREAISFSKALATNSVAFVELV